MQYTTLNRRSTALPSSPILSRLAVRLSSHHYPTYRAKHLFRVRYKPLPSVTLQKSELFTLFAFPAVSLPYSNAFARHDCLGPKGLSFPSHPGGAEPLVLKLATVFGRAAGLQKLHGKVSRKAARILTEIILSPRV